MMYPWNHVNIVFLQNKIGLHSVRTCHIMEENVRYFSHRSLLHDRKNHWWSIILVIFIDDIILWGEIIGKCSTPSISSMHKLREKMAQNSSAWKILRSFWDVLQKVWHQAWQDSTNVIPTQWSCKQNEKPLTWSVTCMLPHENIPNSFWVEALLNVMYVLNLSPSVPLVGDNIETI